MAVSSTTTPTPGENNGHTQADEDDTVGKQVVKGGSVAFVALLLGRAITLIANIILAQHLGAADYGVFLIAVSFSAIASMIATLGIDRALVRFIPAHQVKRDGSRMAGDLTTGLVAVAGFGAVLALILFLLAPELANSDLLDGDADRSTPVLRFFAIGVPLAAISVVGASFAQSMKRITIQQSVLTSRLLINLVVAVLALALGWSLFGVAIGYLVGAGVAALVGFGAIVRSYPTALHTKSRTFEPRRMFSFSVPLMAAGFIYILMGQIDILMVGWLTTNDEVGVYGVAARTSLLLVLILNAVIQIVAPMMSSLFASERLDELAKLFRQSTHWILILSLPIVVVTLLHSGEIVGLFGGDFKAGSTALIILALGQVVNFMTGPVQRLLEMTGRQFVVLSALVGVIVLDLIFNWFLIPRYGATGAASATALSVALAFGALAVATQWLFPERLYSWRSFLPVVFGAVAVGIGVALQALLGDAVILGRYLATAVALVVFLGLVVLFAVSADDREMAKGLLRRGA